MYIIRVKTEISSLYILIEMILYVKKKIHSTNTENVDIASIFYNYKKVSIILRLFI